MHVGPLWPWRWRGIGKMVLLRRLVAVEPVWTLATYYLTYDDTVTLYIAALEADELQTVVRSLEYEVETVNFSGKDRQLVLHCAAAHGCVHAVKKLMRDAQGSTGKKLHRHMRQYVPSTSNTRTKTMQWLNTFRPYLYPEDIMYTAAARGDMESVEWLHTTCKYKKHVAMESAVSKGHLSIAQWLYEHVEKTLVRDFTPAREWESIRMLVPLGDRGMMNWIARVPGRITRSAPFVKFAYKCSVANALRGRTAGSSENIEGNRL
ncbi:hypothetical protein Poli38472_011154 [Pythium oligandrum]|uniref:Ankyrin repeat-containing domain n=1 Tax=Pythium oligandrum TaxID=41045 RepID=A0A8K1CQS1_PYTOL|nr:hypothetical protein Poli38472_011154 [Pythium oligandrum]|eukprot:TMW67534.1 hypothetical protein Poli38472_011154 [Pythium oligandrum]